MNNFLSYTTQYQGDYIRDIAFGQLRVGQNKDLAVARDGDNQVVQIYRNQGGVIESNVCQAISVPATSLSWGAKDTNRECVGVDTTVVGTCLRHVLLRVELKLDLRPSVGLVGGTGVPRNTGCAGPRWDLILFSKLAFFWKRFQKNTFSNLRQTPQCADESGDRSSGED